MPGMMIEPDRRLLLSSAATPPPPSAATPPPPATFSSAPPPHHHLFLMMTMMNGGGGLPSSPPPFILPPLPPSIKSEERGLLIIQLLMKCAAAVSSSHLDDANLLLHHLSSLASVRGDPMQRVACHFMEALSARAIKCRWPGLYAALRSSSIADELLLGGAASAARQIFFNLCPFLKFAFTVANQSIMEAMEGEKVVHVVDLGGGETVQWAALLQMMSARDGGAPHLRVTVVNESKEALDAAALQLGEAAEALDVPFQFHGVEAKLQDIGADDLRVKTGEAVAISAVLQLHYLLCPGGGGGSGSGEEAAPPPVERLLRELRCLSPKIMLMVEQEAENASCSFLERFVAALHYYGAIFDSIECSVARRFAAQRVAMEREVLGRQIHNIVACEGRERVERYESTDRWRRRLLQAGFCPRPIPPTAVSAAAALLHSSTSSAAAAGSPQSAVLGFRLLSLHSSSPSSITLGWQDTPLFTASSWHAT